VQQNLFDSHDTDRFASRFVNPDLGFDTSNRIQDNNPNYNPAKPTPLQWKKMQQAMQFQMAFVGAPMIYYGDEAGMWGPDDPSNRMPMLWRDLGTYEDPQVKFNKELFDAYRRAIAAREQTPALQLGFFRTILAEDQHGVYGFERQLGDQHVYIVLNRGDQHRRVKLPVQGAEFLNWLDPSSTELVEPRTSDPASRTTLKVKADAKTISAHDGACTLEIAPYGVVLLSAKPSSN
jgi:cyclomaltodextrinase